MSHARSFVSVVQVMISRCKCMADWKLIAAFTFTEFRKEVANDLLREVRRLRLGEQATMRRDWRMVEAFLAELNHMEQHMRQCLHDHPHQLGLCTTTLGPNTREAVSFNRALDGIASLRDDLQRMETPKAAVGDCDECGGLDPLREFRAVHPKRGGQPQRIGRRRLCLECEHLDRSGRLFRPCTVCGLLYQPWRTHDFVEPGEPRKEWSAHAGCKGTPCLCHEGTYCPPDDAGPPVAADDPPAT